MWVYRGFHLQGYRMGCHDLFREVQEKLLENGFKPLKRKMQAITITSVKKEQKYLFLTAFMTATWPKEY
jgi:hypothetical protein